MMTVIFSTRNGQAVLKKTLDGYVAQTSQPPWKLIVINNGSSDQTLEILEAYQARLPLRIADQPRPGKNSALNRGLEYVGGDFVVFTDDDAIPDPSFLKSWREVVDRRQNYALFGGIVEPLFEQQPPPWMLRHRPQFGPLFAERDLPEGPIAPTEIYGPNMAVRTKLLDSGLRFDETIGPDGSNQIYPMGSETEFCCRAAGAGFACWFARSPRIRHQIRPAQLRWKAWLQRAYRHGKGVAQQQCQAGMHQELLTANDYRWLRHQGAFSARQFIDHIAALHPIPTPRFKAAWEYHWRRGFNDELAQRRGAVQASRRKSK